MIQAVKFEKRLRFASVVRRCFCQHLIGQRFASADGRRESLRVFDNYHRRRCLRCRVGLMKQRDGADDCPDTSMCRDAAGYVTEVKSAANGFGRPPAGGETLGYLMQLRTVDGSLAR